MINEAYTKLMLQQNTSAEADAAFYEKLAQATPRRNTRPARKAAIVAACVLLLIPVTVWAVESIFGVTRITHLEGKDFRGEDAVGYQAQVENVENIPITEFSPFLQELEETMCAYYDSWEEAEQAVGIDLLSNRILTDEGTHLMASFYSNGAKYCEGLYQVADDQLFAVNIYARYYRNKTRIGVSAAMTADNPQMTEELFQLYHGFGIRYYPTRYTDHITTEQFTTESGIPVTIVYPFDGSYAWPTAYFSVNNVSYTITVDGYEVMNGETEEMADERANSVLREVLEGFTLE